MPITAGGECKTCDECRASERRIGEGRRGQGTRGGVNS
jgi:hypothetical protein